MTVAYPASDTRRLPISRTRPPAYPTACIVSCSFIECRDETGLVAVLLLGRLIDGVLVGVEPTDPSILAATAGFMIASALFACYLPARRAARIDPSKMLRAE